MSILVTVGPGIYHDPEMTPWPSPIRPVPSAQTSLDKANWNWHLTLASALQATTV